MLRRTVEWEEVVFAHRDHLQLQTCGRKRGDALREEGERLRVRPKIPLCGTDAGSCNGRLKRLKNASPPVPAPTPLGGLPAAAPNPPRYRRLPGLPLSLPLTLTLLAAHPEPCVCSPQWRQAWPVRIVALRRRAEMRRAARRTA